jgi:hypothetical protein
MPKMNSVGGKHKRQLKKSEWLDVKKFKVFYDCLNCLYKDEYHFCFLNQECKVVDYPENGCKIYFDKEECNGCPYGNEIGTCFGFCIRAILDEYKLMRFKNGGI